MDEHEDQERLTGLEHGDDCTCFRCKISTLQLSRKPQTIHKFRPVEQPVNPIVTLDRPDGTQVAVRDAEGHFVRANNRAKYQRQLDDLARRSHQSRLDAHEKASNPT